MPGILEPSIVLKTMDYGMLAFTALPSNAMPQATGLKHARLLFSAKLEDVTWEDLMLIYGKGDIPITVPAQAILIVAAVASVLGEFNPADNVREPPLGSQPPGEISYHLLSGGAKVALS